MLSDDPRYYYIPSSSGTCQPEIHRETTAEEIWRDTDGQVDAVVAGVGTGGTITGIAEVIRLASPAFALSPSNPLRLLSWRAESPAPTKSRALAQASFPMCLGVI
jgi:cysteine synthase A